MTRLNLSGPIGAVVAVTQALAALPSPPDEVAWALREEPGRCEVRGDGRASVASNWDAAVRQMVSPPAPLASIRVVSR